MPEPAPTPLDNAFAALQVAGDALNLHLSPHDENSPPNATLARLMLEHAHAAATFALAVETRQANMLAAAKAAHDLQAAQAPALWQPGMPV